LASPGQPCPAPGGRDPLRPRMRARGSRLGQRYRDAAPSLQGGEGQGDAIRDRHPPPRARLRRTAGRRARFRLRPAGRRAVPLPAVRDRGGPGHRSLDPAVGPAGSPPRDHAHGRGGRRAYARPPSPPARGADPHARGRPARRGRGGGRARRTHPVPLRPAVNRARAAGLLLALGACAGSRPAPTLVPEPAPGEIAWTVLLLGDGGSPDERDDPTFAALEAAASRAPDRTTVVFLGDNVYPGGLPPEGAEGRAAAERVLRTHLAALQ